MKTTNQEFFKNKSTKKSMIFVLIVLICAIVGLVCFFKVDPVKIFQIDDFGVVYQTDKVLLGKAETGVYVSVRERENSITELYFEPVKGTTGTFEGFEMQHEDADSGKPYMALRDKYKDSITKVTIKENCTLYIEPTEAEGADYEGSGLFYGLKNLDDINDLSRLDVSKAHELRETFYGCEKLNGEDLWAISNWNTSANTDMSYMFENCTALDDIDALTNWDVSNVEDFKETFTNDKELVNIGAMKSWTFCNNIQQLQLTFANCEKLTNVTADQALSKLKTSQCVSMSGMFYNCKSLTNINFTQNWDVSTCENVSSMFAGCSGIEILDLTQFVERTLSDQLEKIQNFFNISPSAIRHFKMFNNRQSLENWNNDSNPLNLESMASDSRLVYHLKGADKYYSTYDELIEDFDNISGKDIEVVEA